MIYQGFLFVILLILAHFKPLKNCRVVQYMVFEKKAPQKSCHEGHKKRTKSSFYKFWSKVNSLFHQNLSLLNINDAQEKIWPFRLYIFGYTHGRNVVMKVTSWSSWRSQTKNFQKYPIICIHYGVIMKELTFCLFCTHNTKYVEQKQLELKLIQRKIDMWISYVYNDVICLIWHH